jgi:hypothetical protein
MSKYFSISEPLKSIRIEQGTISERRRGWCDMKKRQKQLICIEVLRMCQYGVSYWLFLVHLYSFIIVIFL